MRKVASAAAFRRDLLEQFQPTRVDFSTADRIAQGTPRFLHVPAVVKAALAEIRRELHKTLLDRAEAQVVQAEGLHAGAVDQVGRPDTVWRSLLVLEGCPATAFAIGCFEVTCRSRACRNPARQRSRG